MFLLNHHKWYTVGFGDLSVAIKIYTHDRKSYFKIDSTVACNCKPISMASNQLSTQFDCKKMVAPSQIFPTIPIISAT